MLAGSSDHSGQSASGVTAVAAPQLVSMASSQELIETKSSISAKGKEASYINAVRNFIKKYIVKNGANEKNVTAEYNRLRANSKMVAQKIHEGLEANVPYDDLYQLIAENLMYVLNDMRGAWAGVGSAPTIDFMQGLTSLQANPVYSASVVNKLSKEHNSEVSVAVQTLRAKEVIAEQSQSKLREEAEQVRANLQKAKKKEESLATRVETLQRTVGRLTQRINRTRSHFERTPSTRDIKAREKPRTPEDDMSKLGDYSAPDIFKFIDGMSLLKIEFEAEKTVITSGVVKAGLFANGQKPGSVDNVVLLEQLIFIILHKNLISFIKKEKSPLSQLIGGFKEQLTQLDGVDSRIIDKFAEINTLEKGNEKEAEMEIKPDKIVKYAAAYYQLYFDDSGEYLTRNKAFADHFYRIADTVQEQGIEAAEEKLESWEKFVGEILKHYSADVSEKQHRNDLGCSV